MRLRTFPNAPNFKELLNYTAKKIFRYAQHAKKSSVGKPGKGQRQIHPLALTVDFGGDGARRHPAARKPGELHAQIRTKP